MTTRRCTTALAAFALFLCTQAASANDSYAVLGAGGLELRSTDAVAMEEEDLFLSREEVRVSYVFRTLAPRDVEAVVAFPFPEIDTATAANVPLRVPGARTENFLDFRVTVDGRPVTPALEMRAVLRDREDPKKPEKDITALLAKHKIPLLVFSGDYFNDLEKLPRPVLDEFEKAGAMQLDVSEYGGKQQVSVTPLWVVTSAYHWRQRFPAGRTVKVEHRYKPFLGYFWISDKVDRNEALAPFCIDAPTAAGIVRRIATRPIPEMPGYARATELTYILQTARNWSGPIRRFTLTIDKGQPDIIVSLCMDGLRKVSPTRFTATFTNFVPKRDLRVFFAPAGEPDDGQ